MQNGDRLREREQADSCQGVGQDGGLSWGKKGLSKKETSHGHGQQCGDFWQGEGGSGG